MLCPIDKYTLHPFRGERDVRADRVALQFRKLDIIALNGSDDQLVQCIPCGTVSGKSRPVDAIHPLTKRTRHDDVGHVFVQRLTLPRIAGGVYQKYRNVKTRISDGKFTTPYTYSALYDSLSFCRTRFS